jgi:hypothetical protein
VGKGKAGGDGMNESGMERKIERIQQKCTECTLPSEELSGVACGA